ncbi:glycosyltransferase family 4 protein [Salinigranum rubrum]|nr:glycosyltransferase family 4 protein [Salinigranum rubrum]
MYNTDSDHGDKSDAALTGEEVSGLRVLICTDYLPPEGGGVEVVVENLAVRLASKGVNVAVFSLVDNEDSEIQDIDNVSVYTSKSISLTEKIGLQSQFSIEAPFYLRQLIKRFDPDVIHLHNRFFFTTVSSTVAQATLRSAVPTVTTLHLGDISNITGLSGYIARLFEQTVGRIMIRRSDRIIAVSEAVAEYSYSLGGVPERTNVIPNGVDTERFHPNPERTGSNSILFVGRLVQNKGPQTLIDAMPMVLRSVPDADLKIVGTGPMENTLKARTEELGIQESVRFVGYVQSVAEAMRSADVFCRPSLSEGMPLTVLEAMASGLPAVVTPVAGVPEIVTHGETGVLVPPKNPAELSEAIVDLLSDDGSRKRIAESAREYVVREHSWETRCDEVLSTYLDVLNESTMLVQS